MIVIRKYSITELYAAENVKELFKEYEEESAIDGLPPIAAKKELYFHIESLGALNIFGAFLDNVLVGFVTVLSPIVPHYGIVVAVAESFFVAKQYRKTGAGLRLMRAAEDRAKEIGSPGILFSAPFGGQLSDVLAKKKYKETSRVFFRKF